MSGSPTLAIVNEHPQIIGSHGLNTPYGSLFAFTSLTKASAIWPTANRAMFIPFEVESPLIAYSISIFNGNTVSGNIDVGIHDARTLVRLVSSGSTAQSGIATLQNFNIADTLLNPGLYYMSMVFDNIVATMQRTSPTAILQQACGIKEQATAFPLPDPIVPVDPVGNYVPLMLVNTFDVLV